MSMCSMASAKVTSGLATVFSNSYRFDDDQVDQLNAVLSGLLHVLLGIAAGQQRAVNLGVQGLNAAVHHLGIARELLDGGYGNARVLDGTSRAARRDDLDAKVIDQRPCEIDDTRFIGNRDHARAIFTSDPMQSSCLVRRRAL
mgnify:CR=1 FL=1